MAITAKGQSFNLINPKKRVSIPFKIVRNMMVVPLTINGKGPFNFILDTGVGFMVITEPSITDSINLSSKRTIKLVGLGEGEDFEAYITSPLRIDLPGVRGDNIPAALLKEDHFDLPGYAGMPIHGLLGYEFFSTLAVKINFLDSTLTVCKPERLRLFRKGTRFPITIEEKKPYINASIKLSNGMREELKLVVDLGGGHPLLLENMLNRHGLPQQFIAANIGMGLTGPLKGFISRVEELHIGKYKLKSVVTSFPDSARSNAFSVIRDGNMGMEVLKRFNIIFDYSNNAIYLKPNGRTKLPFEHDMSGIEYYAEGKEFKYIVINRIEPGSAADLVGLEKNDQILKINFKPVDKMTMTEIDDIFRSRDGRTVLLDVYHNKEYERVVLTLKRRV